MLKVDLGLLKRAERLEIDERVPPDSPFWEGTGLTFDAPLHVGLVASEAGEDVRVDGAISARTTQPCRRCLEPVAIELDQPVHVIYRAGIEGVEAEAEEEHVYPLPARARELDLSDAVREHVILGMPEYVMCREDCRGLCPHCGTDLNRDSCDCTAEPVDDRWAALRRAKLD